MSESRKCKKCKRVVFKLIPEKSPYDFLFRSVRLVTVRDHRYIYEERGYICMDCLKVFYPDRIK